MVNEEKLLLKTDRVIEFVKVFPFVSLNFILAVGFDNEVHVYECTEVEKDGSTGEINCIDVMTGLSAFVKRLSWSPDTSLLATPQLIKYFITDSNHTIQCINSNPKNSWKGNVVGEHGNFVNSIAAHPEKGNIVASTADDNLCCIWTSGDVSGKVITFRLTSPGMSVSWHHNEPSKLMVAEKCGLIRFYSMETKQAFMSLDCGHAPLLQAHWSPANHLYVAAVAGTDLFLFNTSHSSQARLRKKVHSGGGMMVMWCSSGDRFLVTAGEPRFQVNVIDVKTLQVSLCKDLKQIGSFDFHPVFPFLYVACDNELMTFPLPK